MPAIQTTVPPVNHFKLPVGDEARVEAIEEVRKDDVQMENELEDAHVDGSVDDTKLKIVSIKDAKLRALAERFNFNQNELAFGYKESIQCYQTYTAFDYLL